MGKTDAETRKILFTLRFKGNEYVIIIIIIIIIIIKHKFYTAIRS